MKNNMEIFVNGKFISSIYHYLVLSNILEFCLCDVTCDFNDGKMCNGWQFEHNSSVYAANWTIWKGPTQTSNTGPSGDPFQNDGYFIYMETTKQKNSDIAIFYTPLLQSVSEVVNVSFWYHMHGIFIQSLKLYVIIDGGKSRELIKAITHEQGNAWKYGTVLFQQEGPFLIAFQAMVGSTFSDIAVDEIRIVGAEKFLSTVSPTIASKYCNVTTESTSSYSTPDSVTTANNSTTDFVPLPYIIICSIGALLWLIILVLLCYCIYRAYNIGNSKHSIACNTTPSLGGDEEIIHNRYYNSDENQEYSVWDIETVSNDDIELVLDARRLTTDHIVTTDIDATKL